MAVYHIKRFSDIDFVNIDAAEDFFILPNGEKYQFSDNICHYCWSGGTVLKTVAENGKYVCIFCENQLDWHEFENDFLPPTGDTLKFLLPKSWDKKMFDHWFKEYKEGRLAEEKVRESILNYGKE